MTRLLLSLAIAALLTPLSVSADPGFPDLSLVQESQGLEFGRVVDDAGQIRFTDAIAERVARAGAGWLHVNFRLGGFRNWTETETFGYSALSLYDEVVATAERHGLQVVGLLSNEAWHGYLADWQANSGELTGANGGNAYLDAFTHEAAVVLARHFAGRVDHWEIWNEPNAADTYLYPSNFAWLLASVYTAIKAAGVTSAQIISGGVSSVQGVDGRLTTASSGADYLSATYARGKEFAGWETIRTTHGSYPLDAVGQHLYVDGYRRTKRSTIRDALQMVRDAYVAGEQGDAMKQTVVTEMGWASGNVSERAQADNLQTAFAEIQATPYVRSASWFFLRDDPAGGLSFGLLRPDGSEKPAWQAYLMVSDTAIPPLPPTGLSATGFPTEVRLDWQENAAPDLGGYHVYRGISPAGPFAQLTAAPIGVPTYVDADAPLDMPLYYQVTAVDTGGNASPASETVGATRADRASEPSFERTWARTDKPVAEERVSRTWMWGPEPFTQALTERYDNSPNGARRVQYFDKSRMEITDPSAADDDLWRVTNGLLVYELMSGWMQVGDKTFVEREPAQVNVAGDPGSGPTYAVVSPLRWSAAMPEGRLITARLSADGAVTEDASLATYDVKTARFVADTRHTIARPFWEFMNASGLVHDDGQDVTGALFENPFYATGYPITEAYWTNVAILGVSTDVLLQCFERRCLTYTPGNPAGWEVEASNVGQHYYRWRYGALPAW